MADPTGTTNQNKQDENSPEPETANVKHCCLGQPEDRAAREMSTLLELPGEVRNHIYDETLHEDRPNLDVHGCYPYFHARNFDRDSFITPQWFVSWATLRNISKQLRMEIDGYIQFQMDRSFTLNIGVITYFEYGVDDPRNSFWSASAMLFRDHPYNHTGFRLLPPVEGSMPFICAGIPKFKRASIGIRWWEYDTVRGRMIDIVPNAVICLRGIRDRFQARGLQVESLECRLGDKDISSFEMGLGLGADGSCLNIDLPFKVSVSSKPVRWQ